MSWVWKIGGRKLARHRDERTQRRALMTMRREIKREARKRRRPILEHLHEPAPRHEWLRGPLGDPREARSARRRSHHELARIERQRTIDRDLELASLLLEPPRKRRTTRHPRANARVFQEIARMLRPRTFIEIRGRA